MRRADRLFHLVQLLRGGRTTTAAALAAELEVGARTIYRDVADLKARGVPIDGEAGVGYILRSGFDMPPLMFDEAEIVALVVGARLVESWGGADMARAAREALVKIDAVAPERVRARAKSVAVSGGPGGGLASAEQLRLDVVERAIAERRRLEIQYEDGSASKSARVVRPVGLWFWGKVWTLGAWCELRAAFRNFRLDRMASAEALDRFQDEPGRTLTDFLREMEACDRRAVGNAAEF